MRDVTLCDTVRSRPHGLASAFASALLSQHAPLGHYNEHERNFQCSTIPPSRFIYLNSTMLVYMPFLTEKSMM